VLLQIRKISNKKKINNFLEIQQKPFTYKDVISSTGVNAQTVRNNLLQLVEDGKIKRIRKEKGVNIYAKKQVKNKAGPEFDKDKINILVELLRNNRCGNTRFIALLAGFNKQYVCLYLQAMASVGVISYFDDYFQVIDESKINLIGTNIKSDILRKLRHQANNKRIIELRLLKVLRRINRIKKASQKDEKEKEKQLEAETTESSKIIDLSDSLFRFIILGV